ncbi:MAG: hypothetical protein AAF571_05030 [Verrucomicrobiota bacterium]
MSGDIRESLHSLYKMRGVIGICLHRGPDVIENLFPRAFSQHRVEDFCSAIFDLLDGYIQAGRDYEEICLKFNGGITYSVNHQKNIISFLLEDATIIPLLGSASHTFLKDHQNDIHLPKPAQGTDSKPKEETMDPEVWNEFHKQLMGIMNKVIGGATSEKLVGRMLASMGSTIDKGLPPSRFRELGLSVVLEIPNRSKQAALRGELDTILNHFADI